MFEEFNIFKYKKFSNDKKRVVSNFFSLSTLEAANYILPLVTLPYLVRVLGPAKFGLIAFAQAFIQYFVMLTDYGFNLSATRSISVNRNDPRRVSQIFSSVLCIKLLIMAVSFIIMSILVFLIPKFRADWIIYLFAFGAVIGNVLFPVWFFQGMERMKFIAGLNILAKTIFVVAIFIFIRSQDDFFYVPLINSLGFIISGILSLFVVLIRFKVIPNKPSIKEITLEFKNGWKIFVSIMSSQLYLTTNTFMLGLFTNNTIVGYFAAGEKIVRALIRMFFPLFQAFYPHISKIAAESKEKAMIKLRKLLLFTSAVSVPLFLVVFIFADIIVKIVLGHNFEGSLIIIRILSPLLIIIPIAYIFANLTLLPFKLDKYFLRIYLSGGVLNIILLGILLYGLQLSGSGAAIANLVTETVLTISMWGVLNKHDLKIL